MSMQISWCTELTEGSTLIKPWAHFHFSKDTFGDETTKHWRVINLAVTKNWNIALF